VLVNPIADAAHVDELAQRIVDAFKAPFHLKTHNNYVGTSIGVALFPDDADNGETLLLNADLAMYSAKMEKGRYCFYNKELHESRQNRLETERELRLAIERDEFLMHYQPRVDARSGRLVGLEALVRWQHPQRGLVGPCEFIAIAESSDLISRLGRLVIGKVCSQLHAWQQDGHDVVPVAINVAARQINHSEVHEALSKCLARWDLSPSLVEVELTESAMMDDSEEILHELERIGAMGIKLHVDDFGTGYSSLALLQRLRLDVLKVDRAFTSKLGITAESAVLFGAIVSMAHGLSMRVIAEGVETREQLEILQSLNCDELQGFYVARPLPADRVPALMAKAYLFPV
jgi:EAL domain-containing protein (putative c-di-GMP-specific phosphodiesterase class I)